MPVAGAAMLGKLQRILAKSFPFEPQKSAVFYCTFCGDLIADHDLRTWHIRNEHPVRGKDYGTRFCPYCGCYTDTEPHSTGCKKRS